MTDCYRFAEKNIQVTTLFHETHDYCRDYRVSASPDFAIVTAWEDIELERERSAREDRMAGRRVRQFSDAYLEELAVYRKIAEGLPAWDTFLFHGSCVAVDDTGYLFTAKSGTGKSTHTRLWRELLGERAMMINDDKPLIRVGDAGVTVYGTPWDGKHRLSSNRSVPLKAVCLLERGERNEIWQIHAEEAYPMLLQQVYRPMDREAMRKTLGLLDRMAEQVRFYRLRCNMDGEAAWMSFEEMKG